MGDPSPNPIDRHVGARIAALREAAELSPGQIADRLGLTSADIHAYERGERRIAGKQLYRLCQVLRCPISALFEGWDDPDADGLGGPHPVERIGARAAP